MKALLILLFSISAHFAFAQIKMEFPPQHKGDSTVYANRYDLSDALLLCDSCLVDIRTIKKMTVECVTEVTSTAEDIQLSSECYDNFINQGSTQSETTFRLPDAPQDGQICRLVFNNAVDDLSISKSDASLLLHTSATATSVFVYKYYTAASAWKRIQ